MAHRRAAFNRAWRGWGCGEVARPPCFLDSHETPAKWPNIGDEDRTVPVMLALLVLGAGLGGHDPNVGAHHWTYRGHAVDDPPYFFCLCASDIDGRCVFGCGCVCVDLCVCGQPLTGDRAKDGTYVGHVEPLVENLCSPVLDAWGYGGCPLENLRRVRRVCNTCCPLRSCADHCVQQAQKPACA